MSLTDNVFFNTRERAISSDINDLESLAARNLMESLRWMIATQNDPASISIPGIASSNPRSVVVGGLQVAPSGGDVVVSPGILFQQSATLSPVPGAFDSSYRFGRLGSPEIVTLPAPGSDTYYLLEAQIVQVLVSSQSRDIYDPVTQTFVPTVVPKQYDFQIQFQLVTGGPDFPAPTGGDWFVLAGIFRPAGGPPVDGSHLFDLATRWSDYTPTQQRINTVAPVSTPLFLSAPYLRTVFEPGAAASNLVVCSASVQHQGRTFSFRSTPSGIDPTAASILSPGTVLAADTWYYLYLVPYLGQLPRNAYGAGVVHQGVLVLSDSPPINSGESPTLALPSPWGGFSATTQGVCIGAIHRNDTNTGWRWQTTVGDMQLCAQQGAFEANIGAALTAANLNAGIAPSSLSLPVARSWVFDAGAVPISPPIGTRSLAFARNTGAGTLFFLGATTDEGAYTTDEFEVPQEFTTTIAIGQLGASGSSLVTVLFKGFKWWGAR